MSMLAVMLGSMTMGGSLGYLAAIRTHGNDGPNWQLLGAFLIGLAAAIIGAAA